MAAFAAISCLGQTGTVTFYSRGITAKSEVAVFLPKSEQPFGGWLSDGPQKLAHVRFGRFATFHVHAGVHSFTVEGPTGPGKAPLVIDVKDGGQYCVRLFAKMINLDVYGRWENQIEQVPCQRAQHEAAHLKPLESKRVDPAVSSELDPAATFPGEIKAQP